MKSLFDPVVADNVRERLAALTPASERRWGRMTPHGAACHLADSFVLVREGSVVLPGNPVSRTVMRWVALSLPVPWPKGVPTTPQVDQENDGTPPGDFADDVDRLRGEIARFIGQGGREMRPHPIFLELTPAEWGRWGYRHLDHHFRQFGV